MNIWIFNHYAHPPDLPGGTRHYDLGRELVRRGHRVVIFATSFHHYLHRETRLQPGESWKIEEVDGVKFVWIRTPPYQRNDRRRVLNMVAFMLRAWRLGRKLPKLAPEVGRPDVVIGSSPHLLTPLAAYGVAKRYRARFIMEVRDLWPQTIIDMGELSRRHPIIMALQALERYLYRRAEKVLALLPLAHQYITACGVPREKVVWIPNGVDLSRFDSAGMPEASHEGFRGMYLGAHGQANALDVLLQAAKVVEDRGYHEIRFILVGDGPEKPGLMTLAQELGLSNVEFREPVSKAEVPKALHEADAFVFNLEKTEVFRYGISSNKLFDYMSAARPVIFAVDTPSNPVAETHCGLTVPPREPQALAEAVIKLYQMPKEEREALGRRGRAYVEEHHDIRKLAERLEGVLVDVVHGP
ncbi:MAG: Glycosyltransferase [Candidatus Bipolaricaulis sibiricus]|uniref:Glycosyltransferase n=1 Tax=Bipolaricaulis sibiricus TaxID=2501609 RepID=A0A410FTR9_BIPS1|nr:MAG: Glycosyltransferase [Candidatus Bipolaricaulis sibiricus]